MAWSRGEIPRKALLTWMTHQFSVTEVRLRYSPRAHTLSVMPPNAPAIAGKYIRLEKLSVNHIEGLCACLANERDGWFSRMYGVNSPHVLRSNLQKRLQSNDDGTSRSFVTVDLASGEVAGLSHFMKIDARNRQLEIGGTQVGQRFRRTYVNTETKLLMLTEAFENMGFVRVYFKVDTENQVSQKAMERLGFTLEGKFRNAWIVPDGRVRSCFIYSVIDSEWPETKARLVSRIAT